MFGGMFVECLKHVAYFNFVAFLLHGDATLACLRAAGALSCSGHCAADMLEPP
jgi:hypothetical protein